MAVSNKVNRLRLLVDLATKEEDQASTILRQARQALDDAQQQLDSLKEYRESYLAGVSNSMKGASNPYTLTSYQQFVAQLDNAIDQQSLVVNNVSLQFEQAKKHWVTLREKTKSLAQLRDDTHRQELAKEEKKQEARMLDDFISSKYR
ncbi:MAG: flagellar export protein FliJ [Oleiphilaceae bacterium]|nr:flagellar export protein FliJ [Oleiphilaceae bacterium]